MNLSILKRPAFRAKSLEAYEKISADRHFTHEERYVQSAEDRVASGDIENSAYEADKPCDVSLVIFLILIEYHKRISL